jgi:hypothetical protein
MVLLDSDYRRALEILNIIAFQPYLNVFAVFKRTVYDIKLRLEFSYTIPAVRVVFGSQ